MPFKSRAQMIYMINNHPDMAKKWRAETPNPGKLPERKSSFTRDIVRKAREKLHHALYKR